ncbi:MAG: site-2 protease family protein [Nitrospira sp.]|nr:site-2 protease family protein [Nitrospira sp.]
MDLLSILKNLVAIAPGALIAITFHEAAHGFIADRKGDPTAKMLGRLTLNPLAHIDLFGTILLPIMFFFVTGFVFGYAKPVPVNFLNLHRPKKDMIWVAAAGPGTNLCLALLSGLLLRVLLTVEPELQLYRHIDTGGMNWNLSTVFLLPIVEMLRFSVIINIVLMVFNMVPIPPLDGGRVMVGLLPEKQANALSAVEPYGFLILLFLLFIDPSKTLNRIINSLVSFFYMVILGGV